MLGLLHPLYKEFKFCWGREKYLSDKNLSLLEKRYIFMARTEMLPINYKPWFRDQSYTCQLCNTNQDEDITHFIKLCPALRGCRPASYSLVNTVTIRNDFDQYVQFIISALKTRKIILNDFDF